MMMIIRKVAMLVVGASLAGCASSEETSAPPTHVDPMGQPPPSATGKPDPMSPDPSTPGLCPAPACAASPCAAATVATLTATVASLSFDADTLYALLWQQDSAGKILAQPLVGVAKDRTTTQLHASLPYQEAAVADGSLFGVSLPTAGGGRGHQRLESRAIASLDAVKVIADALDVPRWGLAATKDHVFFGVPANATSPFPDTAVMAVGPSGGAASKLGTTRRADAWAADESDAFVADSDAGAVVRFPLAGGTSTRVAALDRAAIALALDDTYVYAVVEGSGVMRAPRAGAGAWTEITHGSFRGLTAHGGAVYFGDGKTLRCVQAPKR